VREALGDLAHDLGRQAEGKPRVAQGVPGPVGLGHAGDRGPLPSEPFDDRVVDLQAPLGFHVQVDVRQRGAALAEEPLEQQTVLQGVGGGHEQRGVDHGTDTRAACGDPDPERPGVSDHLGHGQEVALKAEPADDVELVAELSACALVRVQAAGDHPGLAPLPQQPHRRTRLRTGTHNGRLGKVRPTQPEVDWGQGAGLAGRLGVGQQARGPRAVVADGLGDPFGGRRHGGRVLQPPLAAVQVSAVDRAQQPRRIEDVGWAVLGGSA
jgi:hypothetical protein